MLDELQVRNIALIEDANLCFSPSLTVLTGETGAGKTALLSALKLLSGQRADSHVVREGSAMASLEARMIDAQGEEHIISRSLSESGRSRCKIDAKLATVAQLHASCASIRVISQNEHIHLLDSKVQHDYLDAWMSDDNAHLVPYRDALKAYKLAKKEYEDLLEAQNARENELEYMRFVLSEIDKVNPEAGEYEELEASLPRMQNADALISAADSALASIQADDAASDKLAHALNALSRLRSNDDQLEEIAARLEEADALISDASLDLSSYRASLQFDPADLEAALNRLHELSGLMKRFGPSMDEVLKTRERACTMIKLQNGSSELINKARAELQTAQAKLEKEAHDLHKTYQQAAHNFCACLAQDVKKLAMEDASFSFEFKPLAIEEWDERGSEKLELFYSPAAAASKRPLSRIASGGELSRILLAIECMQKTQGLTFVFDEVDQGIGGMTANAVAQRLAKLSARAQVIVVTHLAQVAACAKQHYVVLKQTQKDALPITDVHCVDGEERISEIARMLSGDTDVKTLVHAQELLEKAQAE